MNRFYLQLFLQEIIGTVKDIFLKTKVLKGSLWSIRTGMKLDQYLFREVWLTKEKVFLGVHFLELLGLPQALHYLEDWS